MALASERRQIAIARSLEQVLEVVTRRVPFHKVGFIILMFSPLPESDRLAEHAKIQQLVLSGGTGVPAIEHQRLINAAHFGE